MGRSNLRSLVCFQLVDRYSMLLISRQSPCFWFKTDRLQRWSINSMEIGLFLVYSRRRKSRCFPKQYRAGYTTSPSTDCEAGCQTWMMGLTVQKVVLPTSHKIRGTGVKKQKKLLPKASITIHFNKRAFKFRRPSCERYDDAFSSVNVLKPIHYRSLLIWFH